MQPQNQCQTSPTPNIMYGTVCRINFWARMTTALGITQIVIGLCCIVFYMTAYMLRLAPGILVPYMGPVGLGITTGSVILSAGTIGTVASKRRTRCMITSFLTLSILSVVCAMFPMVIGVLGASYEHTTENNLLMPITELVFATVEIVVATWSVGVCCQAMCCPNTTLGQVSTRYPASPASSLGVTHFLASGDGNHVVLFASAPNQPPVMYSVPASHVPYVLQNGITTLPLVTPPRVTSHMVTSSYGNPAPAMMAPSPQQLSPQDTIQTDKQSPASADGETERLLHADTNQNLPNKSKQDGRQLPGTTPAAIATAAEADNSFEVEDEQAALLE